MTETRNCIVEIDNFLSCDLLSNLDNHLVEKDREKIECEEKVNNGDRINTIANKSENKRKIKFIFFKKNKKKTILNGPKFIGGGGGGGLMGVSVPTPDDLERFEYTPDRNGFVRMVLFIVLIMLLLTAVIISIPFFVPAAMSFCRQYQIFFFIGGTLVLFILHYVITCGECVRSTPCNVIALFFVLLAMSCIAVGITVRYKTHILLIAFVATTGVVLVCFLLALTRIDFTKCIIFLIVAMAAFMLVSLALLMATFILHFEMKPWHIALSAIGAVLQSFMLIIELQLVLGGKSVELGEGEYVLGAYMIYSSIVNLFLYMVQLVGGLDS